MNAGFVERGDKVEEGEDPAFTKAFRYIVDAGKIDLAEGADGVEPFMIHGDVHPDISLGGDSELAGVRGSERGIEVRPKVYIQDPLQPFGDDAVEAAWREIYRGAAKRNGNIKWQERAGAEDGLGCDEDVGKTTKDVANFVDDPWRPAIAVEIESDVAQVIPKTTPKAEVAELRSPLRRTNKSAEGVFGGGGAAGSGGQSSTAIGILSCKAWTTVSGGGLSSIGGIDIRRSGGYGFSSRPPE